VEESGMADILRLASVTVGFISVALVAALLEPKWADDLGLGPLDPYASLVGRPDWGPDPNEPLFMALQDAKRRVTLDLIDGRLTLFEAAALFRHLHFYYPGPTGTSACAGDSEEERLCRQVICWARTVGQMHCAESEPALTARLESELSRHKEAHGGMVILPEQIDTARYASAVEPSP
jgi:hypothetical protein